MGGGSYPTAKKQSVYSTAPADWAIHRFKCQAVLFQIIQFSISTQFRCQKQFYFEQFISALVRSSNVKTVLFCTIQCSINTQFKCKNQYSERSTVLFYLTLSGATTPGQNGPGSDGNEGVLCIPQSSNIAGTSPSDSLVSYPGHSLVGGLTPLQRSSWCILQPQPTGQAGGREICDQITKLSHNL